MQRVHNQCRIGWQIHIARGYLANKCKNCSHTQKGTLSSIVKQMLVSYSKQICDEDEDLQNIVIKYEFSNIKNNYPRKLVLKTLDKDKQVFIRYAIMI